MQNEEDKVFASLTHKDIRISKVKLAQFPQTGRGLAAAATIRNHEILLTIPTRHLLNLKSIGKDFGFDWTRPPIPAHVALTLYIMYQKSLPNSHLRSYIDSLPKNFDTVPLTWNSRLVNHLTDYAKTYLSKQKVVLQKHISLARTFVTTHAPERNLTQIAWPEFTDDEFLWAWLVINSRCIYQELSPVSTRDDNYACSPLVDMINHVPSSIPHCKLSYDIKGLSVISQSSYAIGEEIFISYGAHSNEALLCEYGFTVRENSDDSISLDDALILILQPCHQMLLMELGYFEEYTVDAYGYPSFRIQVALRAARLSEDECLDGAQGCRSLIQFANGQVSGSKDQKEVDDLLRKIIQDEMNTVYEHMKILTGDELNESEDVRIELMKQLWSSRLKILQVAQDRIRY